MDPYLLNDDPFNGDEEIGLKEYLSLDDLRKMTGCEDLSKVRKLEAQIDAVGQSVGPLGERLPNLQELRFNGGLVHSLRDLGTSLKNVTAMFLSRCGVHDLSGSFAFPNIEELYISYNNISDLSPLASMTKLRVLDIEGNSVSDVCNVQTLSRCPLEMITVTGNPFKQQSYLDDIKCFFPNADVIDDDDEALCDQQHQRVDITAILEELDSQLPLQSEPRSDYINSLIEKELNAIPVSDTSDAERFAKEMRSVVNAVKELRFCDPYASLDLENDFSPTLTPAVTDDAPTEDMWDVVKQINNTRKAIANSCQNSPTGASDLTHHTTTIFCGNATRSLRNRKHEGLPSSP
eukprot:TRINITY_DN7624_c0_g2_i2.p1 TRINITY_DN7624_c0_g2~~TRINITY_DN7624_c0_g2_i2.p1  ORF type:complete len:348 (+),score=62.71 TRINITY_DN7624_c0_g2_i2:1265-2308(+)